MSYESHTQNIDITGDQNTYSLSLIMLTSKTQRLAEVQVISPHLIRIAQDMVEYNASALEVRPHDRLQDLLRQLPGLRIDASGRVTVLGESMTKLHVNGEDFLPII